METIDILRRELNIREKLIISQTESIQFSGLTLRECRDLLKPLLFDRREILNKMFSAAPEEMRRFEAINNRLLSLTRKMYSKAAALYRNVLRDACNEDFDDDVTVEGCLRYSYCVEDSILRLETDDYYGSDFNAIMKIIRNVFDEEVLNIEYLHKNYNASDEPEMEEEDLFDLWTNNESQKADDLHHPILTRPNVCHAIRNLCIDKFYAIPDLLRMNHFYCETKVSYQHIAEQDGRRFPWWEECEFNEFRDKMLAEAEHRPASMSLGEFLVLRCGDYFDEMCIAQMMEDDDRGPYRHDPRKEENQAENFLLDVWAEIR